MIHVYGIPSCDSVRKAQQWLKKHRKQFVFHDFRSEGVTTAMLKKWSAAVGWEVLLNKKSTTWRSLPPEAQDVTTQAKAVQLMNQHPTLIKRPVIEYESGIVVGYNEEAYTKNLKA